MSDLMERELGWDDEISNDSSYEPLPEGTYDFVVVGIERGRHNGSDKLPPCNKAPVEIKVTGSGRSTTIKNNFFLHTKTEGLICAFFTSIGVRKDGEPYRMDWSNNIIGKTGRCKIGIRQYTGNDGREYINNEVKQFLKPGNPCAQQEQPVQGEAISMLPPKPPTHFQRGSF